MRSSELTIEQRTLITEWICSNPHAALEIVVATHSQRWYGCECCIQTEVNKRKAAGSNILDVSQPLSLQKVF